jgi:hypothetical protein
MEGRFNLKTLAIKVSVILPLLLVYILPALAQNALPTVASVGDGDIKSSQSGEDNHGKTRLH